MTPLATVANAAVVGLGASPTLTPGWFGIFNGSAGTVDVISDVSGYFVAST